MKKLLFTLATFLVFVSCRSIEKMVEKGQYDEAIVFATEKLAGKKNKKTKHVKALEEAFAKITRRDMEHIKFLDGTNKPENWDKIFDVADKIERRQNRIEPFLPLVAKDGYEAHFEFVKTYEIKTKALNAAAEYHYSKGMELLDIAIKEDDKRMARTAYSKFEKADLRKPNYKDVFEMKKVAYELGQVRIKVDVVNESFAIVPENLERHIKALNVRNMNSLWRKYHVNDSEQMEFDYKAEIVLTNIEVSPERETITHHEDTKEVKDGFEYLRDRKGDFVIDTTGSRIKVDKFRIVRAQISEIFREKSAVVGGAINYFDLMSGDKISTTPLNVEAVFSDYASSFRGDRRALCNHDINRLKEFPLPFPDHFSMIIDASENLKGILTEELVRLPI